MVTNNGQSSAITCSSPQRLAPALAGHLLPVESRHPLAWDLLGTEQGRAQATTLRERSVDITTGTDLAVKSVEPEHDYRSFADLTDRTAREAVYNIIFRKNAPLQVLEIFPNLPVEPAFFFLFRFCGFDYHAIIGNSPLPWVQPHCYPFWLDPDVLVERLEDMLEADPSPRATI
jgi:hypothetical protein